MLVLTALDGVPLAAGALVLASEPTALVGRAERARATLDGRAVDAYFLGADDARLVARLVGLGTSGLGGFFAGGKCDDGRVVALRRSAPRTLADLATGERPSEPTRIVLRIAEALAAAESAALGPGPLRLADVAFGEDGEVFVSAESLVRALLGDVASATAGTTGPSPRWTPPEQANGAPWDAAANRYVLGLIAYRLIAGEHPFVGAGLRHAIDAQSRVVPPFEDAIASGLRAGVQSLVLVMLDPDPSARPRSAAVLVERWRALVGAGLPAPAPRTSPTPARAIDAPRPGSQGERPTPGSGRVTQAPVPSVPRKTLVAVFAAASALALVAWLVVPRARADQPTAGVTVRERGPVTSASAEACAPCHAKQVEEWKRSVMAFSSTSPLYRALESAVEEQAGRDDRCPGGAGVLRPRGAGACVDPATSLPVTGSGGENWCVHCHAPLDKLATRVPAWNGTDPSRRSRPTLTDVLSPEAKEGISCIACHASVGPVDAHANAQRRGRSYEGNPTWTSTRTGVSFSMRPEDARGVLGISNSGYGFDPTSFFRDRVSADRPFVHDPASASTRAYLSSSEFCGACHDVRLFGTDVIGARDRGEHFKRLRNAYSEWRAWSETEARAGRRAASCQECHMSTFPGVCEAGAPRADLRSESCPPGTGFVARAPGRRGPSASHYFTGVEVPQADAFDLRLADEPGVDADGVPLGLRARRDLLLRSAFSFALGQARVTGGALELPLVIENVGAGHRVPAGFSQEREFWVELRVRDARGSVVYEVGRVDRPDQDLPDKRFLRVRTDDGARDGAGRPLGVFGADVTDGPDAPRFTPDPARGGTDFRGLGLVNFQNGFLRCVRCIGVVAGDGSCLPGPGQGATRADRFEDGDYDPDTGECRSNLFGGHELFETYFPVGALDADRGVLRAPDAIIDTRSAPPGVPIRYTYVIPGVSSRPRPFRVEARLRFRAFPPFLLRAFASYERDMQRRGERPSGPQLDERVLSRLEIVDLARAELEVP